MKKLLVIILFIILAFGACRKSESSSSNDFGIFNPDKKNEAAEIIKSANEDLKKVRKIYKENQNRVDEELIPAMNDKNVEKAKEIATDLVKQINSGLEAADDAVKKIKEAENMDINDTYKEYLRLKREALEMQIEAFELRRQVAQLLSQSFGGNDSAKITKAQSIFKDKEIQFHDLMEKGKGRSEEANQIYKDSLKQK